MPCSANFPMGPKPHRGHLLKRSQLRPMCGRLLPGLVAALPFLLGARPGDPFRYAEDRPPSTLNPAFASTMVDTRLEELLFESLFTYDRFLNPVPSLAASWQVNPSRTVVTVFLREALWHDGKPVTASDVAFTIAALQDRRSRSTARVLVKEIKSVSVQGPTQIELRLKRPLAQPERALMFKILPRHLLRKSPLKRRDRFRVRPVGSGPYRFVDWEGTTLDLEAHHHMQVGLPKMQARFIPDKKVQLDFLQYDGLEAVVRILPRHRPVIEGMAGKIDLLPYESLSWWYLGINHTRPHTKKRAVRKALAYALDRDEIRAAHLGDGQTISGPFAPRSPFYNDSVKPYPVDPKRVTSLMTSAGYRKPRDYWVRGGQRVRLRLAVPKDWKPYEGVTLDIQTRLRRAGFDVSIAQYDSATFAEKVREKRRFDLTIGAWSFDEASSVYGLFHSRGRHNYFGYRSKRMDELLEQSQETRDPELFRAIYHRVHEHAHKDLPYLFLWSVHSYTAISTEVTGVDIHPFRYFTWVKGWSWKTEAIEPGRE